MHRLTLPAAALALVLAAPSNAAESGPCAEFRQMLAIERATLSALNAAQDRVRIGKPQVQERWEAFFGAARARKAAADKVAAAITDKAARAVLVGASALEDESLALAAPIVSWKVAAGRAYEGLDKNMPEEVFAALSESQAELWSAAVAVYHETLKAACRIGQVGR